jgi:hypothetical protein
MQNKTLSAPTAPITQTGRLAFDFSVVGSSLVAKFTIFETAEESGAWSHRADSDRWQDDFASDFEETD